MKITLPTIKSFVICGAALCAHVFTSGVNLPSTTKQKIEPTSNDHRHADRINLIVEVALNHAKPSKVENKDSVRNAELTKLLKNNSDLYVLKDKMYNEDGKLEEVKGTFIYANLPDSKSPHLAARWE